jgi:CO dehydrogenase/acetyl-CoA synthase delta subunit
MKKSLLLVATLIIALHCTFAATPALSNTETKSSKPWLFKPLAASDVSLEVERIGGEVMLHLYSKNMRNVEMIYVEKSSDPTNGFSRCKTVKVSDFLVKSKNYIGVADVNPGSTNTDSYYRIRTVSTGGDTKIYSAVDLAPLYQVEPQETVER